VGDSIVTFQAGPLRGTASVPGDKSISHRALIVAAHCPDPVRVDNLNPGRDVAATRAALSALGKPFSAPASTLDCMNSGSTARMLLGACAGAGIAATFDGDASLRRRPMEPVAAQLRAFGARIETAGGCLPARLLGRPRIETTDFILLAPSAQVKSALLFAGLFAGSAVSITGDRGSRDHTERLLQYLGADIEWSERVVRLGTRPLSPREIAVVGDFSAAAFFITAAAITPGSAIVVRDVGVNPTRTGLLEILTAMGARIALQNERTQCGEPIADVTVEHAPLVAANVSPELALRAIDEIPLAAVAAACAAGTSTIAGIGDLRTKESDRIAAIERLLAAGGAECLYERGVLRISGRTPARQSGVLDTGGDHRIAMAAAVLACLAGPLAIDGDESIAVSFPDFRTSLSRLREP
jgi:3-phosphoshikimate 1-carboxyvinyltransferase